MDNIETLIRHAALNPHEAIKDVIAALRSQTQEIEQLKNDMAEMATELKAIEVAQAGGQLSNFGTTMPRASMAMTQKTLLTHYEKSAEERARCIRDTTDIEIHNQELIETISRQRTELADLYLKNATLTQKLESRDIIITDADYTIKNQHRRMKIRKLQEEQNLKLISDLEQKLVKAEADIVEWKDMCNGPSA